MTSKAILVAVLVLAAAVARMRLLAVWRDLSRDWHGWQVLLVGTIGAGGVVAALLGLLAALWVAAAWEERRG